MAEQSSLGQSTSEMRHLHFERRAPTPPLQEQPPVPLASNSPEHWAGSYSEMMEDDITEVQGTVFIDPSNFPADTDES
jgi:hypothetical protein